MLENVKRKRGASDFLLADATRKTNTLNEQRNALIASIDEAFNKIVSGDKIVISGQNTKVYQGEQRAKSKDKRTKNQEPRTKNQDKKVIVPEFKLHPGIVSQNKKLCILNPKSNIRNPKS